MSRISFTEYLGRNNQMATRHDRRFRFKLNERVRLKDAIHPVFYQGLGCVGNEGWVKACRLDDYSYPQIYIEWDKDHWAYNGAPDIWTWENHFERITVSEESDHTLARELIQFLEHKLSPEQTPDPEKVAAAEVKQEGYNIALAEAFQVASQAEAFAVVAVARREHPDISGEGVLVPFLFADDTSTESALLVNEQMSKAVAASHERITFALMHRASEAKSHE